MKTADSFWIKIIYIVSVIISGAVAFLILGPRPEGVNGALDVSFLPRVNATINAITTLLLVIGYFLIIITEIEKGGEKYNISSRYFNSNLYNPILNIIRNFEWFENVFSERQKCAKYRFSVEQVGMDLLKFANNPDKYTP